MKMKFYKVLHLFGLDALLIKLLEKLVTALNKKLDAAKAAFVDFLNDCHQSTCECVI